MNFIQQGRLTKEFEIKKVGETYVSESSLAYDSELINKKTGKRDANFTNIQIWGESFATKSAKFYKKGSRVLVQGFLESKPYKDKNGNSRVATRVTGNSFRNCTLLDYLPKDGNGNNKEYTPGFDPSNDYSTTTQNYGANSNSNGINNMDLNPDSFSAVGDDEDIPF